MANGDAVLNQTSQAIEEKKIDASKKLKVGIIGTGWIAEAHVKNYLRCPDVEIVAAADLVPGKAEKFCKDNGIRARCYESGHAMLEAEELDGVSICTSNTQHAPCAIDALEHGVHVMLEKPFTVTLDEAVAVMRAEKKSGKILTIGYQPRMSANIQMIKKIIDSGELGKLRHTSWLITNWWRPQGYYDQSDWRATWGGEGGGDVARSSWRRGGGR